MGQGGEIDHTGLNPRALKVQIPACAGRIHFSLIFLIFARAGGDLHFKALPFRAGKQVYSLP